jgi:uncharacterized protein
LTSSSKRSDGTVRSAVLDSNVLVSAFLTGRGAAADVLRAANRGAFRLYLSREILAETRRKLLDAHHIRRRYAYPDERAIGYIRDLALRATLVTDLPPLAGIVRDPDDDVIVACAVKARAGCIVTRDKDLLALGTYQAIRTLTPRQFLDELRHGA